MGAHTSREGQWRRPDGDYRGEHRSGVPRPVQPEYSGFRVDSPERAARGVGNAQTGGDRSNE